MVQDRKSFPPTIFIHAFPFNQAMWEPQIEAFSAKWTCLTYDIRGFGKSDPGDGQYTLEMYVDDLRNFMDQQKVDQSVVCGLSMGGYIALRAIEKYPEKFAGLILCDTKSEADSDEIKIKRAAQISLIKKKGLSIYADDFLSRALSEETKKDRPQVIKKLRQIILFNSPLGACGALLAMAGRTDTTPSLGKICVPTLILVGEHDALTPPLLAEAMHRKIAGSEMHVIAKAGHISNLENLEEFNQRIRTFLNRINQMSN